MSARRGPTRSPMRRSDKPNVPSIPKGVKSRVQNKLGVLANRFDGFEEHLNLSRAKKKEDEEKKIQALQQQLNSLQDALTLESKNRAISMKALQSWLGEKIDQFTQEVKIPLNAKIDALDKKLDHNISELRALEKQHQEDRETFPQLIDARSNELLNEIRNFKIKYQQNILAREEKEKKILLRIQDTGTKLKTQFEADKVIQEKKIRVIRQDIVDEVVARQKGVELVRKALDQEIVVVAAAIEKEVQAREAADEDLVSAIGHYAAALQDGIKIVSTQ